MVHCHLKVARISFGLSLLATVVSTLSFSIDVVDFTPDSLSSALFITCLLFVSPWLWVLPRPCWIGFLIFLPAHLTSHQSGRVCGSTWKKLFDSSQCWFLCSESSDSLVLVMKGSSLVGVVKVRPREVGVLTTVRI